MKFAITTLFAALVALTATAVPSAIGAPVPLQVSLTNVWAIQPYTIADKPSDTVYFLTNGIAGGQEFAERLPADKALPANPKLQPVDPKNPLAVWKGSLDDGQFALITVVLMQGAGTDADRIKQLSDKLLDAEKKVAERADKTITDKDFTRIAEQTVVNQQAVITKIKDILSREKKTDHFGGLFNVLVWNNGGKIVKRLDPVGLTEGEQFGNDIKIYSKLKNTRANVFIKDDSGEWTEQALAATDENGTAVRVKMLETEYVTINPGENPTRKVTDYVVESQVLDMTKGGAGTPTTWDLKGEKTGVDDIHTYWLYAGDAK